MPILFTPCPAEETAGIMLRRKSFFGHMKDEIRDKIKMLSSFDAVKAKVDDWIDYYNKDRYQWNLIKLYPQECYQYLQTGVYPLPVYDSEKRK